MSGRACSGNIVNMLQSGGSRQRKHPRRRQRTQRGRGLKKKISW